MTAVRLNSKIRIPLIAGMLIMLWGSTVFSCDKSLTLDRRVSSYLQGNNQHIGANYFWESVALSTPFIEYGTILYHLQKGITPHAGDMLIATVASQVTVGVLKILFRRPRPHQTYQPRLWNPRITPSFPSGHTTSSAAFATTMAIHFPGTTPLMAAFSLASGYSQVYVGNHYISDVLAGWVLGYLIGRATYALAEKNNFLGQAEDGDSPSLNFTINF